MPEPVAEMMNKTEPHVRVLNLLKNALPGNKEPESWRERQNMPEAEAEAEPRVIAPPVLQTEHPWVNRTAEEFWNKLQDEVLMDTASDGSYEAEPKRKPKRDDFIDHEDR